MQFFKDADGNLSSKRLFGLTCLIIAIVTTFTTGDVAQTALWLGTGGAVFGVQAFTKT